MSGSTEVNGLITMEPVPANVMSPDEMLLSHHVTGLCRTQKSLSTMPLSSYPWLSAAGPINFPKAVVKKRSVKASLREAGSKSMRVLFNAAPKNSSPTTPTNSTSDDAYRGVGHGRADGQALSPIEPYNDENLAGMGTANAHPFGYHPNAYTGGSQAIEEEEEGGGLAGRGAGGGGPVYYAHAC